MKSTEINVTNIENVIQELLKESGRTKVDISKESNISVQTLFNWTVGKQCPRIDMFCYYLDELGYKLLVVNKDTNLEDLK